MKVEELFYSEAYWQEQEPWKSQIESIERANEDTEEKAERQFQSYRTKPIDEIPQSLENESEEFKRRYLVYRDKEEKRRQAETRKERERLDREDNWRSRLEYYDCIEKKPNG